MNIRIATALAATMILAACSQGQKDRVELMTEIDSVSYAIGADIGANFKRSKLDDVNVDALALGLREGLDSTSSMTAEQVQAVVQGYMMKLQEEKMAEERAKTEENRVAGEKFLAENGKRAGVTTTASGLQYEVITTGKGPMPLATDKVVVNYHGTLIDGEVFDSTIERGEPVTYPLNGFIQGWQEALQMMPTGSKWKLYVPSDIGYGPQPGPGGSIPGNSVLIFDLELLEIVK